MTWKSEIKIKHLFTEDENHEAVQTSMNKIADEIEKHIWFKPFDTSKFRAIPEGDGFFSPVEYANKLLSTLYDYADNRRIWIR